jgi:glycosyltransferase involved in cell wall biosynthesis
LLRAVSFAPDRLVVIPNPVSPEFKPSQLPPRKGPFRLLHIGTKPNKNLERLVPALEELDVELTVIGSMTGAQKALFSQYSVKHRALEGLDAVALRDEYARAEAVIFVSLDEGFGLPIIEAQASGRPVITSDRAPMAEVAGKGALLVDPESGGEIRAAVARLASDSSLRYELVAKGAKNVERFSPSAIAKAYADLYRKVSDGHGIG